MQYNYNFEIAALVLMFVVFLVYLFDRKIPLAKNKAFFAFLNAAIFETVMNISSSLGLAHTDVVSDTWNNVFCVLFFVAEMAVSLFLFQYVLLACEVEKQWRKRLGYISMVPVAIFGGLLLTNPWIHGIYIIKDGSYKQGFAAAVGYWYVAFFIFLSMIVALSAHSAVRGLVRYAVCFYSVLSLLAVVGQYVFKTALLTGFANAIIIQIMYMSIQNPREFVDSIANVLNDRGFYIQFENNVAHKIPMTILTVDIQQHNQLNAVFGYQNGNIIQEQVGKFLVELTKKSKVYHISANVFALILDEKDNVDELRDDIMERFEKSWKLERMEVVVAVNVAQYEYPENIKDVADFFGVNEHVKRLLRKNTMQNFQHMTSEIRERYDHSVLVKKALMRALEEKSIQVYFQPIISAKTEKVTSMEALARIIDPELGFIPPDEFISIAEENGTIVPLDLLILEKSCQFLEQYIIPNNDKIGLENLQINISVLQCLQPNMDELILDILHTYGIPSEMIVLEVTERAAVSIAGRMEEHMNRLKASGINFALDDYGTGNSNCSYLISYPFSKVKFDKDIVWSYFTSKTGKVILDGEIKTIHNLNIPIVAEGIENKEQLDTMRSIGVEYMQGYYFAKPMPEKDAFSYLMERNEK